MIISVVAAKIWYLKNVRFFIWPPCRYHKSLTRSAIVIPLLGVWLLFKVQLLLIYLYTKLTFNCVFRLTDSSTQMFTN